MSHETILPQNTLPRQPNLPKVRAGPAARGLKGPRDGRIKKRARNWPSSEPAMLRTSERRLNFVKDRPARMAGVLLNCEMV